MGLNPGFEHEMRKDPHFRIAMREAAVEISHLATTFDREAKAPWMPRKKQPIEVKQYKEGEEVYVVNTDYAAAIVEFGGKNNPPFAPLRRAVRAAGFDLREAQKGTRDQLPE